MSNSGRSSAGSRSIFHPRRCLCAKPATRARDLLERAPDAGEPLTRAWKLVTFLEEHGFVVQMYKTNDPGMRVHRDDFQVAAIPQGMQRVRKVR